MRIIDAPISNFIFDDKVADSDKPAIERAVRDALHDLKFGHFNTQSDDTGLYLDDIEVKGKRYEFGRYYTIDWDPDADERVLSMETNVEVYSR